MTKPARWPKGTPVAPGGKGPGGGRYRAAGDWAARIVSRLEGTDIYGGSVRDTKRALDILRRTSRGGPRAAKPEENAWLRKFRERNPVGMERVTGEANLENNLEDYARTHGMTDEQARAHAEKILSAQVPESTVAIRVHSRNLPKVLRGGRFLTQFESVSSGGYYDPEERANFETSRWGLPADADPAHRPIYGYLLPDGPGTGIDTPGRGRNIQQYGDVQVILKDRVRGRTTFNVGYGDVTLPTPMADPGWESFHFGQAELTPDLGSADYQQEVGYLEAHIHGGVQVEDIERVVFTGSGPDAGLAELLGGFGIGWDVVTN